MTKFGLITILIALTMSPLAASGENPTAETPNEAPSVLSTFRDATAAIPALPVEDLTIPADALAGDRARLEGVLQDQEAWTALGDGERAGILVALADRTALDGDRDMARELYAILVSSEVRILSRWGIYMTAGIDFAEGSYASAAVGYATVCESETPVEWRDHACSMAGLAQRLEELESAGGEHDGHATATP